MQEKYQKAKLHVIPLLRLLFQPKTKRFVVNRTRTSPGELLFRSAKRWMDVTHTQQALVFIELHIKVLKLFEDKHFDRHITEEELAEGAALLHEHYQEAFVSILKDSFSADTTVEADSTDAGAVENGKAEPLAKDAEEDDLFDL